MTRNGETVVLLGAHDDGGGAFGTLFRFARALWHTCGGEGVRFIFLHSFVDRGNHHEKPRHEIASAFGPAAEFWPTANLVTLPKDPSVGRVRPDGLLPLIADVGARMDAWPTRFGSSEPLPLPWKQVNLAISMGVPWLHREARRHGVVSIELGDMQWSMVLRGSLQMADRLTPDADRVCDRIRQCELLAREAWLIPFAAPIEYVQHFAAGGVPVNWLSGPMWGEPPETGENVTDDGVPKNPKQWQPARDLRAGLKKVAAGRTIVGLYAGRTHVWDGIMATIDSQPASDRHVVFGVKPGPDGKDHVWALEPGANEPVCPFPGTTAFAAASDLFLSRGGITAITCVATNTPVAVTEEHYHWLSARQRESLTRAGLCLPIPLRGLQQSPRSLIDETLLQDRAQEVDDVRERTRGIRPGGEWPLARCIGHRLERIAAPQGARMRAAGAGGQARPSADESAHTPQRNLP